ncbi:hypothetical protein CL648_03450 [bacterium]|jgi:hypothetical protein|nr:hypothetical protein [bacterium]|tara:strand:+ start:5082 stop:5528 length:447 start_codon:yes stop_codon:yes gene_type:complete
MNTKKTSTTACEITLKLKGEGGPNRLDALAIKRVQQDGLSLKFEAKSIRATKAVVLAAVKENGKSLEFASDELKEDGAVVLAAVNQNGWALSFAHECIKNKPDIMMAALRQNGRSVVLMDKAMVWDSSTDQADFQEALDVLRALAWPG